MLMLKSQCAKDRYADVVRNSLASAWTFVLSQWGLCEYAIVHTILAMGGSPVIQSILLGGKPKWLPLKFGYHVVMRTSPIVPSQALPLQISGK